MKAQHIPGLAIAIQQGTNRHYEGYYGYANLEHHIPVTANTVFEIASVTKLFTAQAVLRLVQQGKVNLDNAIAHYLTDLPASWDAITIRHCLTHQSGIPNYTGVENYWEKHRHQKSHAEVLDLARNRPLDFDPGTRYSYDNTGFYLLGMVIEAVSEQAYADYLQDEIFDPLAMLQTQGNDYEKIIPHRAQGYAYHAGKFRNKPFYDTSNTFSAGILLSTVQDLLTWQASLADDRCLQAKYRQLWWTPHPSQAGNEREFHFTLGLGWFMVDHPQGQFMGHNGGIPGFATAYMHFPQTDLTAAVMCNCDHIDEPHQIAIDVLSEMQLL